MGFRSEIYDQLRLDSVLSAAPYSLTSERIWPNFALDISPRRGYYLVMRWGPFAPAFSNSGKQKLTIWGYVSRQTTTDFDALTNMISRIEQVFNLPRAIGSSVSCIDFLGRSDDLVDEGYDALAKNSTFDVIAKR